MFRAAIFVGVVILVGCAQPPAPVAPPPTPAPIAATPVPQSAAAARADAMIEDLRRRQTAQAKFDRENPAPPSPRIEDLIRPSSSAPIPTTPAVMVAATGQPALPTAPAASSAPARDEQWWKNEMRSAQVRLENNIERLQAARDQARMALEQMRILAKGGSVAFAAAQEATYKANAEVNRYEAEIINDRAAVERVREDARRANVPPGWLRWP